MKVRFINLIIMYRVPYDRIVNFRDPVPHLPPCVLDPENIICMTLDQSPYHAAGEIWYATHWKNPFDKGKPSKLILSKSKFQTTFLPHFRFLIRSILVKQGFL